MQRPSLIPWRRGDRLYLPLLAVLVFVLATTITLLYVVFNVVRVDGDSMAPVLQHNDRLLVTRGYGEPRIGDIVAFEMRTRDGQLVSLVKRVVAVGGDEIEILGDVAYVNGELSSVAPDAVIGNETIHLGPALVPEGSVFVLGDNRPVSLDSRFIGTVPLDSVTGRGYAIVWPMSRLARSHPPSTRRSRSVRPADTRSAARSSPRLR